MTKKKESSQTRYSGMSESYLVRYALVLPLTTLIIGAVVAVEVGIHLATLYRYVENTTQKSTK